MKTPEEFVVSDLLWEDCVHNPHDTVKRECYRCLAVLIANRDREVAEKAFKLGYRYGVGDCEDYDHDPDEMVVDHWNAIRALDLEEVLK